MQDFFHQHLHLNTVAKMLLKKKTKNMMKLGCIFFKDMTSLPSFQVHLPITFLTPHLTGSTFTSLAFSMRRFEYGCFLKWWYPQIIRFNRVFHYPTKTSEIYPYLEYHPIYSKWLGSSPFTRHKRTISKGSHNPT